jgi:SNF2 family DNA or RNA helicase
VESKTSNDRLQKFCCYFNLANVNAEGDVSLVSLESVFDIRMQELAREEKKAYDALERLRQENYDAKELARYSRRYYDRISSINYYKKQLEDAFSNKQEEQDCPICLEPIEALVITNCGHKFCQPCLQKLAEMAKKSWNQKISCPECRTEVDMKQVVVKKGEVEAAEELPDDLRNYISHYGTKVGNLIVMLQQILGENSENKVLIFSQYDRLLRVIGNVLEGVAIKVVYPCGHVTKKLKELREFIKSAKNRVLLLSFDNSAAGTNLNIVSHVIFLDNILFNKELNAVMKQQGIGRAIRLGKSEPVRVYHLKIKNTIEEYSDQDLEDRNLALQLEEAFEDME